MLRTLPTGSEKQVEGFRGHAIGKNFLLAAKLSLNFASYWVIFLSSL
jgi:hypothetical protein